MTTQPPQPPQWQPAPPPQQQTQPQWRPQPEQPPSQPPQRRKLSGCLTFVLIIVGILVVAGIIGAVTGEDTAQQSAQTATTEAPGNATEPDATTQPPATARGDDLREPMRDGQFQFTVQSVKCGQRRVGDQYLNATAQGQFCLVAMKVENIGDEARTLSSGNQYLFDERGRKYETDDANLYVEKFGKAFLENINPGNSVNATLVYDVPRTGFKPLKLELHDSAFSGGVEVQL